MSLYGRIANGLPEVGCRCGPYRSAGAPSIVTNVAEHSFDGGIARSSFGLVDMAAVVEVVHLSRLR